MLRMYKYTHKSIINHAQAAGVLGNDVDNRYTLVYIQRIYKSNCFRLEVTHGNRTKQNSPHQYPRSGRTAHVN